MDDIRELYESLSEKAADLAKEYFMSMEMKLPDVTEHVEQATLHLNAACMTLDPILGPKCTQTTNSDNTTSDIVLDLIYDHLWRKTNG